MYNKLTNKLLLYKEHSFEMYYFSNNVRPYDLSIIFALSGVRTLGFCSFEGKVFILSLPNLAWVFIGLIACMGLLLVKIGL